LHKAKKHFPYIFQYLTALHRYTGGVVVASSNLAVPTNYVACVDSAY
jgi:hypothetical protein